MDFSRKNRFQEARLDVEQIYCLTTNLCELDADTLTDEEHRALSARVTELRIAATALDRKFNGEPVKQTNMRENTTLYRRDGGFA
jgi:hypothetical protein